MLKKRTREKKRMRKKEMKKEMKKEREMIRKMLPAPKRGCPLAVRSSQVYLPVRREHRIKQISTALKQLTAAPRPPTAPPLFCFFFLLRVRLLLWWWLRESEGERAVHRPHTHSSFSLSVCVPLHGLSPSPHPTMHTHNVPVYICMHTHACPLVLSFAPHAPLP
ncbi:trans-sialidase, putative, partial [Trypanosoma cruzi marinkellei]